MKLNNIWTPWRLSYIKEADKIKTCIFCESFKKPDRDSYIVYKGKTCFVVLNIYPYNNGHIMIAPYRHVASLEDLNEEERTEIMDLMVKSIKILSSEYNPHGFNIGINLGKAAGAGVEHHLHVHIVPRWVGDTNFMPVLGETKVLPELLDSTWDRLRKAFNRVA